MSGSFGPDAKENKPLPSAPDSRPDSRDERYPITIRRDGVWLYHGSPIQRHELVRLFSTVLSRDESGTYWLITPVERGRITVEDVPFIGIELLAEGDILKIRTNIEEIVPIDSVHPLVMRGGMPYVAVRSGLEARLNQASYYELVKRTVPRDGLLGVYSAGVFFPIGPATDDEVSHDA